MTFMREKLRQFMIGRYGTDGLNQFLSIASLVLLLIAIISRVSRVLSADDSVLRALLEAEKKAAD